jgi:hypothetical protein
VEFKIQYSRFNIPFLVLSAYCLLLTLVCSVGKTVEIVEIVKIVKIVSAFSFEPLPAACCLLSAACCLLPAVFIAHCLLPIAPLLSFEL